MSLTWVAWRIYTTQNINQFNPICFLRMSWCKVYSSAIPLPKTCSKSSFMPWKNFLRNNSPDRLLTSNRSLLNVWRFRKVIRLCIGHSFGHLAIIFQVYKLLRLHEMLSRVDWTQFRLDLGGSQGHNVICCWLVYIASVCWGLVLISCQEIFWVPSLTSFLSCLVST